MWAIVLVALYGFGVWWVETYVFERPARRYYKEGRRR